MIKDQDLLDDNFDRQIHIVDATSFQRFLNFIIDFVAKLGLTYLVGLLFGIIALSRMSTTEELEEFNANLETPIARVIDILLSVVLGIIYHTVTEAFFAGKSIGKLITGTRAVNLDGTKLTFGKALTRSLCRYIPFEPFSFLASDRGWHDTITDTRVIIDKESTLP